MKLFSKFLSLLLILCIFCLPLQVQGASQDTQDYIQRMIQYYLQYQEQADEEIAVLLDYLCQVDPAQGELWRNIMVSWAYTNSRMQQHRGILAYGPEEIHISGGKLVVQVKGANLELRAMTPTELLITGEIHTVELV